MLYHSIAWCLCNAKQILHSVLPLFLLALFCSPCFFLILFHELYHLAIALLLLSPVLYQAVTAPCASVASRHFSGVGGYIMWCIQTFGWGGNLICFSVCHINFFIGGGLS